MVGVCRLCAPFGRCWLTVPTVPARGREGADVSSETKLVPGEQTPVSQKPREGTMGFPEVPWVPLRNLKECLNP